MRSDLAVQFLWAGNALDCAKTSYRGSHELLVNLPLAVLRKSRQMWKLFSFPLAGGIVLNPSFYGIPGHTHTMIHEIGHSLGLYHVFRGISEILSCSDPCMETEPSFETGDLCSDTNPAPKHKLCGDPGPGNDTCGFHSFLNTPFSNFMSYAGTWASSVCCWCLWLGGNWEQQYQLWFLQCISYRIFCWHVCPLV